jgi:hypothetical protein
LAGPVTSGPGARSVVGATATSSVVVEGVVVELVDTDDVEVADEVEVSSPGSSPGSSPSSFVASFVDPSAVWDAEW